MINRRRFVGRVAKASGFVWLLGWKWLASVRGQDTPRHWRGRDLVVITSPLPGTHVKSSSLRIRGFVTPAQPELPLDSSWVNFELHFGGFVLDNKELGIQRVRTDQEGHWLIDLRFASVPALPNVMVRVFSVSEHSGCAEMSINITQ